MFSEYTKNLLIYYNNLSTYYVICVFMSVTAIILTWIFHTKDLDTEDAKLESENVSAIHILSILAVVSHIFKLQW